MDTKTECLTWTNEKLLSELINKRISVEFNIRKNKPRYDGDIYSIEKSATWDEMFPAQIQNALGRNESSFSYVLRHTFYTPRHLLTIINELINDIDIRADSKKLKTIYLAYSSHEWSLVFQKVIEEFTVKSEKVFQGMFSKVYIGFEELMESFQSRPNIWLREQLMSYIREKNLFIEQREDGELIHSESLVYLLQRLGFLGLGTKRVTSVKAPFSYSVRYSYLEKNPTRKPWDLAVITPLFYDSHNIRPVTNQPVIPHDGLPLSFQDFQKLSSYNHILNIFRACPHGR